jgi:sterol desaturase/sphingolipid hydroxylase (fatty acid hydroxylase superfamily)
LGAFLRHGLEVSTFVYFGLAIAVSLLEWVIPHRPVADTVGLRWLSNIGIAVLDTVLVRSLFPMLSVGWAEFCNARGWGLLYHVACPAWLAFVLTLVTLDAVYYAQHYALHRVPLLWRLHRTHHTDQEFDFSTGVRSHPFETMLTTAVSFAAIFLLGAPAIAVLAMMLLSVGVTFVDHANVRVPSSLDRALRLVLVTPDMHRIHHSQDVREGESNLSNLFSWWDRLFATYRDQPAAGPAHMVFGAAGFEDSKHLTLPWMLAQPFLHPNAQARADSRINEDLTGTAPKIGVS